jgi:hypothetical protein
MIARLRISPQPTGLTSASAGVAPAVFIGANCTTVVQTS